MDPPALTLCPDKQAKLQQALVTHFPSAIKKLCRLKQTRSAFCHDKAAVQKKEVVIVDGKHRTHLVRSLWDRKTCVVAMRSRMVIPKARAWVMEMILKSHCLGSDTVQHKMELSENLGSSKYTVQRSGHPSGDGTQAMALGAYIGAVDAAAEPFCSTPCDRPRWSF